MYTFIWTRKRKKQKNSEERFFWFLREVLNWFELVAELESFLSEITVKT